MEEKRPKKVKKVELKEKSKKKTYEKEDEEEDIDDYDFPIQQQQQQMSYMQNESVQLLPPIPTPPPLPPNMNPKQKKYQNEPLPVLQKKISQSLPMPKKGGPGLFSKVSKNKEAYDSFEAYDEDIFGNELLRESLPPLPPITVTQNLNEILSGKLQSQSIKAFKVN